MQRLHFGGDHQHWSVDDWKNVLCTDKRRISLKSPEFSFFYIFHFDFVSVPDSFSTKEGFNYLK